MPRLITIQVSHFCEKARWTLQRAGVEYVEEPHLQGAHVVAALRARGGTTVPVLVADDGAVARDSAAIVRWCDARLPEDRRLIPDGPAGTEAALLEQSFGDGLGPAARLWAYGAIDPLHPRYDAGWAPRLPGVERVALRVGRRGVDLVVRRFFDVTPERTAAALAQVEAAFDAVAARLQRSGGPYLLGERLTAADVSFAALATIVLLPPRSEGTLPPLDGLPEAAQAAVRRLREHPAGEYGLALWAAR